MTARDQLAPWARSHGHEPLDTADEAADFLWCAATGLVCIYAHGFMKTYPHGYKQPAVLITTDEGWRAYFQQLAIAQGLPDLVALI